MQLPARTGLLFVALLIGGTFTTAQSLGELASREKARREAEKNRKGAPPRVYTQEDLEKLEGRGQPNSAAASNPAAPAPSGEQPPATEGMPPAEGDSGDSPSPLTDAGREKSQGPQEEWRERQRQAMAAVEAARQNVGAAEGEVERLKQELNPMSTTFTNDPYAILQLQAKLTEAQARATEARKQVDAAQQIADDVVAEARRNGVYLQ
ncbi:MAG TPA: hypothetical protein VIZ31_02225 [Vicinamibacteria bacterium]